MTSELMLTEIVQKDTGRVDNTKDGEATTESPDYDAPGSQASLKDI
jgi:hypothetical protein